MKRVLFIGLTDYDLSKDDSRLEQKWGTLAETMKVHILARGQSGYLQKYQSSFYLIQKKFGRLSPLLWSFVALFWGRKIILSKNIDVIISQSPSVEGFVATLLGWLTGKKVAIEVHGDWINGPFYYYKVPFSGLFKQFLRLIGKFSLRRAAVVRVISEATRNQVLELVPEAKIVKFAAFTPVDDFLAESNISFSQSVVFIGALYKIKGVHNLLQACIKVKEQFPEFRLDIFGIGPMEEELKKLASPLGSKVVFHGHCPLSEIKLTLKNAGVFVLPSLSEGLGLVLIEAAALGKPLIGSNVGGIPELVRPGENGWLVEAGNVEALTEAIIESLNNPELSKTMGERGRAIVKNEFSPERFFAGYKNMINSL